MNSNTHRGGWGFAIPGLTALEDILPRNYSSFILTYKVYDPSRDVFDVFEYHGNQVDVFSCPG